MNSLTAWVGFPFVRLPVLTPNQSERNMITEKVLLGDCSPACNFRAIVYYYDHGGHRAVIDFFDATLMEVLWYIETTFRFEKEKIHRVC